MSIIDVIENALTFVEATAEQIATRVAELGNGGTQGPPATDHPVVTPPAVMTPTWSMGWWSGAVRMDAHVGRIGPAIDPVCAVAHTTDMHPNDWDGLLKAWKERPGDGSCATFAVGRHGEQGTIQLAPITRNANHAGGATHGVYVDAAGRRYHPNVLAVGIEFHCAGGQLRRIDGVWRYVENGIVHGAAIPDADVDADPARPGRGWHRLTRYQLDVWRRLRQDLGTILRPMPAGLRAVSTGEAVPAWGVARDTRVVGHVTLDPTSRSDPWPNGMAALELR